MRLTSSSATADFPTPNEPLMGIIIALLLAPLATSDQLYCSNQVYRTNQVVLSSFA